MSTSTIRFNKLAFCAPLSVIMLACAGIAAAQQAPIVQPGAPGQAARELTADEAVKVASTSHSPDDLRFMQDMIPHHHQAVEMSALVAERTNRREIVDLARRIDASQADEIAFMQGWLRERGASAPEPTDHHAMHMSHKMAGMATAEQMSQLAAVKGTDFDRLFLELMIAHHKGAVTMVEELHKKPGSAYDPVLFEFTNDIVNDQTAEVERMNALVATLSNDPRAALAPGFRDAGEAILNLTLVASLPKPPGFFDPKNPAGVPPIVPDHDKDEDGRSKKEDGQGNEDIEWGKRSPLLSFSNTDMSFAGDTLFVGNYHGINIYKLGTGGVPEHLSSLVCPGGQGDVSVVGDLMIMSVEQTRGRVDCGLQGVPEDISSDRFRGLRIFDISDLKRPMQVGQVQTCRGSHTHSVISGPGKDGKIIVYNSGTSSVRDEEELDGCIGEAPGDDRTALFRIDVIEIPVDAPSKARIVSSPAVFADPKTGRLAGLWRGGDHGDDTQDTSSTNHCHDITAFPAAGIAAGACSGNGILFDISDPLNPRRIDEVVDSGFAYWHSATFNNDGTKVLFTDEWGGGSRPRCRASDPRNWGANAIYDIVDGKLVFRSYYKLPAPQVEQENCVAHNGSVVPVPGRDIFAQSWYQGGLSVIDFTDSANPVEIAYFDRGPLHEDALILGGYWSSYWYGGKIYATEIVRGLDMFALEPSKYMSANEIEAAALADQGGTFNPQQQYSVTWPAEPVIARAYMDQLARSDSLPTAVAADVKAALDRAGPVLQNGERNRALSRDLTGLAKQVARQSGDNAAAKRLAALSQTLEALSARLR